MIVDGHETPEEALAMVCNDSQSSGVGRSTHLVIVGSTNAGKTTAGKYIQRNTDILHLEASAFLRELLAARGMGVNHANIRSFFQRYDNFEVAARLVDHIATNGWPNTVITGPRLPSELEYLISHLPKVVVVEVTAPREIRLHRALNTRESEHGNDIRTAFFEKESLDQELGLGMTLNMYPDLQIDNTGPLSRLYEKLSILTAEAFGESARTTK